MTRQSTTMLGPPRSAAMTAVGGHTVARLLIKPSPTDMVITGGARNITLPAHTRPTRLPTAEGNRPNHHDSPHLEQHMYVLKTAVWVESIVTMRCWIWKWKLQNAIKWGIVVTGVGGFLFGSGAQLASFSIIAIRTVPRGKVAAVWSTKLTSVLSPMLRTNEAIGLRPFTDMPSGDWWLYFKIVSGFFDQTQYFLSIRLVQATRYCMSVFAATALAERWCTKVSKNSSCPTLYIYCSTVA
jgi:hypothetical protein